MKTNKKISMLIFLLSVIYPLNMIQANQIDNRKSELIKEAWDKEVESTQPVLMQKGVISLTEISQGNELVNVNDKADLQADTSDLSPETLITKLPDVFNKKVSLKAKNQNLKYVLSSLAKDLNFNIIYGPGTEDPLIDIDASDIEAWRVLNTVLYPLSYAFKVQNNDLVILSVETRIFKINLPPVDQSFKNLTSNESFSSKSNSKDDGGGSTQDIRVGTKIVVENSIKEMSFWDDIAQNIQSLASIIGKYSINKLAGTVVVTDKPGNLDQISHYMKDVNIRSSEQIEVDVKVIEVTLTDEQKFGVDWNALLKSLKGFDTLSLATNFATNSFSTGNFATFNAKGKNSGAGTTDDGVNLVIKALNTDNNVEIVSQPKVRILNNQVAVIQVGTTQAFVDESSIEATETGTITSISTSQVHEGVTMRLVGNINNGKVYLSVTPVITTIDSIRSITSGNTTIEAPQTTTKSIDTVVKLEEGQTVAIGGLITAKKQSLNDSVPVLSRIPGIGNLFKVKEKTNNRTELIIFITPKGV